MSHYVKMSTTNYQEICFLGHILYCMKNIRNYIYIGYVLQLHRLSIECIIYTSFVVTMIPLFFTAIFYCEIGLL